MSTYSVGVLALSPTLYWRLGETVGTTGAGSVLDSSGNSRTGTPSSGTTFGTAGALTSDADTAVTFDDTVNGRIDADGYSPFTNATSRTYTGWAWRNSTASADNDTLFGGVGASPPTLGIAPGGEDVTWNPDPSGAGTIATWTNAWPGTSQWVFWALTFNESTDVAELFINGSSVGTSSTNRPYNASAGNYRVGVRGAGGAEPWNGRQDEAAVFASALSAANILDLYQRGTLTGPYAPPVPPTVVTSPASSIGATGATLNGTVNPNGISTTALFEYGLTTGYGTTVSLGTVGSDSAVHTLNTVLSGLTTGLTYHYRISATSSAGTSVGSDVAFSPVAAAITFVPAIQVGLWTFDACDGSGNVLTTLTRNAGTSVTYTRNYYPECVLSLSHDDDECAAILTAMVNGTGGGMPTLKGYRVGTDGTKVLRFNGYLAAISEESGTEASTATFTFRGPFGRLLGDGNTTGRFTTNNGFAGVELFTATDAGQIAKALVDSVGTVIGLTTTGGTIQATKNRDRLYSWANAGQAIIDLTNVLDGFDFDVAPVNQGSTLGVFSVYAKQGVDRPATMFQYGEKTLGNCSSVHRQTLPPINLVRVMGNGITSGTAAFSTDFQFVRDSPSQTKYGAYAAQIQATDVTEPQTLIDKAYANLRPNPIKTLDFTADPRLGPSPFDDYAIGDTVYFYANRNAFVEGPSPVRVNQMTVVVDPDTGLESAEIPDPLSPDDERVIRAGLQTEVVT